MTEQRVRALLEAVARGALSPDEALERLSWAPMEDLGFARIDHHRALRQGLPEVVSCPGKTPAQLRAICERLARRGDGFLATRADEAARATLARAFPKAEVNELGRTVHLPPAAAAAAPVRGPVLVMTDGTGDLPVAEEAAVTARAFGNPVERLNDVGVAGLHRLLAAGEALRRAAVVNIDNGFGAACAATRINRMGAEGDGSGKRGAREEQGVGARAR